MNSDNSTATRSPTVKFLVAGSLLCAVALLALGQDKANAFNGPCNRGSQPSLAGQPPPTGFGVCGTVSAGTLPTCMGTWTNPSVNSSPFDFAIRNTAGTYFGPWRGSTGAPVCVIFNAQHTALVRNLYPVAGLNGQYLWGR